MQLASVVHQVDDLGGILHQEGVVEFPLPHHHFSEVLDETFSGSDVLIIESAFTDQFVQLFSQLGEKSTYVGNGAAQKSSEVLPFAFLRDERLCNQRSQQGVQRFQGVQNRMSRGLQSCVSRCLPLRMAQVFLLTEVCRSDTKSSSLNVSVLAGAW